MPYTCEQLNASLVLINESIMTLVTGGSLSAYTLPTGVHVTDGLQAKQLEDLGEYYQRLLRSYCPQMALSRGY